MKSLLAIAAAVLTASLLSASESYSIDVTITKSKSDDQSDFAAVVSELAEEDGDVHETTIAKPRVITTPGSPGSFYVGSCAEPDSQSISMEVTWPEYEAHGVVICTVTVKRGERVVARSRMKATLATTEHERAEPIAPGNRRLGSTSGATGDMNTPVSDERALSAAAPALTRSIRRPVAHT